MQFFTTYIWYILIICWVAANFMIYYGHHSEGINNKRLAIIGGILSWVILIAGFILTGWLGGFALMLMNIFLLNRLGMKLAYVAFKKAHPEAVYLTYKLFKLRGKEIEESSRRSYKNMKAARDDNQEEIEKEEIATSEEMNTFIKETKKE